MDDLRVAKCNYAEDTKVARKGASAWVVCVKLGPFNPNEDRVEVVARSRGGRLVQRWEHPKRLTGWRMKTISPGHPLYRRAKREWPRDTDVLVAWMRERWPGA